MRREAEREEPLRRPLLSLKHPKANPRSATLCLVYVLLSASGPVLLDWVKRTHGGQFPFAIPALTFHAWGIALLIGLCWAGSMGGEGLRMLNRPDMIWRHSITTAMFCAGDILSFVSLQHLDVGTFSLVGKAFGIIITVGLSRLVLGKRQSRLQYGLVAAVAAATAAFCASEQRALGLARAGSRGTSWLLGLGQRAFAVLLTSFGAVLQERLLNREPGLPFLLQQCWMGCGAMAMSYFTLRVTYGLPTSQLFVGFGDWRVQLLLLMYTASGLTTGLMVKRLGAVAKALCVPIYLGGCYAYAVHTGSATLTLEVVMAWTASTACILLFAVTKALGISTPARAKKSLPS